MWIIHKGNHISIFALCELGLGSDFSDEIHDRKRRNPNHKFLFRLTSKSNSKTLDKSMHVYNYGSLSVVKLGLLSARGRRNVVLVYNCEQNTPTVFSTLNVLSKWWKGWPIVCFMCFPSNNLQLTNSLDVFIKTKNQEID